MWRDLWLYLKALAKHWVSVATGSIASLAFLLSDQILKIDVPRWVLGACAIAFFFWAGFLAWRDEHAKGAPTEIDTETQLRRPLFDQAVTKLDPKQEEALEQVVHVGDSTALDLQRIYEERGQSITAHDADMLLTTIRETTGLLEVREKGNAYGRHSIKPQWSKLLVEWAAPPTAADVRIADKAQRLRRMLAATYEEWPAGPQTTEDVLKWAVKLAKGSAAIERALEGMVELRTDASRRVSRAVAAARDAYFLAAKEVSAVVPAVINPWIKNFWVPPAGEVERFASAEESLRKAWEDLRTCLAALDHPRLAFMPQGKGGPGRGYYGG